MRLTQLSVQAFRNLLPQDIAFHPRTTVLLGHNGQGKTNVLEAIYLLAALRSFRTTRLSECICFDAETARVSALLDRRGGHASVEVSVTAGGRRVLVDGEFLRSARQYQGDCSAVVFVPEDLTLARGSPQGRRRFLDRGVFASNPAHLADLQDYDRALRARNTLLREGRLGSAQEEAQREVLARLGATVLQRRLAWIAALRPLFNARFQEIAETGSAADLAYEASGSVVEAAEAPHSQESLAQRLLAQWGQARTQDAARGFTTVGPHCDDLALSFAGHPLRVAGSQGQQRAFVLALKLAEIAHAEALLGEPPILLLDDVGSELDELRRRHLFTALERAAGQVVLTTTSLDVLPETTDRLILSLVAGRATPLAAAQGPSNTP